MGLNSSIPQDSANFNKEQWKLVYQPYLMQNQFVQSNQSSSRFNQQSSGQKNVNGQTGQQMAIQFKDKYQVGQFLPQFGNYKLVKNTKNGIILQMHQLGFSKENQYFSYLEKHYWRQKQELFVNSYYLTHQHLRGCCSYTQDFLCKVFVEHMQVRLSDLTDIPYPENLYVIQTCLKGFQKLFYSVGYFKITQDLIGVNRQGKIKVWLHSNLAINTPQINQSLFADENPEFKMVRSIIDIVERETDEDTLPNKSFSQYLIHKKKNISRLTFAECITQIQKYAKFLKIKIPSCFGSMLQIINDQIQDGQHSPKMQILSNKSSSVLLADMKNSRKSLKGMVNNSRNSKALQTIYASNKSSKNGLHISKHQNSLQPIPETIFYQPKYYGQTRHGLINFNPESLPENHLQNQMQCPYGNNNYQQQRFQYNNHNQHNLSAQGYNLQTQKQNISKSKSSQLISIPTGHNQFSEYQNIYNTPDLQNKFGHFKPIVPYNFLGAQNKSQQKFLFNGNTKPNIQSNIYSPQLIRQQSMPQSAKNSSPVSIRQKSIVSNIDQANPNKKIFDSQIDGSENDMVSQLQRQRKIQRKSEQELQNKSMSSLNSAFAQASNTIPNHNYLKKSVEVNQRKFDPRYQSQIQSKQIENNKKRKENSPHRSVISVSKRSQKGQLQSSVRESCETNEKMKINIFSSVIAKPEQYNRPVNVYVNHTNQVNQINHANQVNHVNHVHQQRQNIYKNYSQISPNELQKMTDSDLHFMNNVEEIERKYILEREGSMDVFDHSYKKNYLSLPKKLPYGLTAEQIQKYRVFSQCNANNKNESQVYIDPQIVKDLARYGF